SAATQSCRCGRGGAMATHSKGTRVRKNRTNRVTPAPQPAVAKSAQPAPIALPAKSLDKAAKALGKFTPSRFAADSHPENYLPAHHVGDPKAVHAMQRKMMARQIKGLPKVDELNPGMSLALSKQDLKRLLPSYDA